MFLDHARKLESHIQNQGMHHNCLQKGTSHGFKLGTFLLNDKSSTNCDVMQHCFKD